MTTKPINPTVHGILDYLYGAIILAAPFFFGFTNTTAATILYIVGIMHLSMSLMTAYPLGLIRSIPFTVHSKIEISTALFLIAAPWLFGFAYLETARNFYVITGLGLGGVWSLTDYYNMRKRTKKMSVVYPFGGSEEERKAA